MKFLRSAAWYCLVLCAWSATAPAQGPLPSPQQTFGFPMGADKKLVDWRQIVSYLSMTPMPTTATACRPRSTIRTRS